jgi:hypothetical protein
VRCSSYEQGDRPDMSEVVEFFSSQRFYLTARVAWAAVMTGLWGGFTPFVSHRLAHPLPSFAFGAWHSVQSWLTLTITLLNFDSAFSE